MKKATLILLGLALLVCAGKSRLSRFQHLTGWQKLFWALAVVLTVLIILNPEFLALGLFGDTAFFDLLVLALSLQMHGHATRVFHRCVDALSRGARWLGIPSPGLRYLVAVLTPVLTGAVAAIQKAVHRVLS